MPRESVALCIRANFEAATYVGFLALQRAVDYWRNKGLEITDLAGNDAVRDKVLSAIVVSDPILIFGVGHGNEDLWTGQNYDNIFWTSDSKELSGRVVYALSCITAARLGPDAVGKGCRTYIGYDKEFGWVMDVIQDPMLDSYARSFYEPVLELLYRLMDGATAGDAFKASMDKWNSWIDYWSRSTDSAAPSVLQGLIHDRDCQKLLGDETATITIGISSLWWVVQLAGAVTPLLFAVATIGSEEARKAGIVI